MQMINLAIQELRLQRVRKLLSPRLRLLNITADKEIYSLFDVEKNPALTGKHRISIDPELPAGLIYRIQMGVFSKPLDPSFFKGIYPVTGFRVPGTEATRYFVGMFRKMDDASRALLTVKADGIQRFFHYCCAGWKSSLN